MGEKKHLVQFSISASLINDISSRFEKTYTIREVMEKSYGLHSYVKDLFFSGLDYVLQNLNDEKFTPQLQMYWKVPENRKAFSFSVEISEEELRKIQKYAKTRIGKKLKKELVIVERINPQTKLEENPDSSVSLDEKIEALRKEYWRYLRKNRMKIFKKIQNIANRMENDPIYKVKFAEESFKDYTKDPGYAIPTAIAQELIEVGLNIKS